MKTRDNLGDWIWDDRDPLDPDPLGDPLSEGVLAAVARQAAVALPVENGEAQVTAPDNGVPPAPAPPMLYVPRAMARRHWEGWSVRSVIITGLVVVAVFVAAVIPQLLPDPPIADRGAGAPPAASQRVVSWSVSSADRPDATYIAVIAAGGVLTPTVVAIPGHATIDVPGQGLAMAGEVAVDGDEDLIRLALSNLLGVTVDISVPTTMAQLEGVVDGIGGIDVLEQSMDGWAAVRYLTLGPVGEERFLRWQEVLEQVLAGAAGRPEGLDGLPARLASTLERAAAAGTVVDALPVRTLGEDLYRPEMEAVERLVAERFEDARTLEQEIRLVVLNGVGVPGVGEGVAEILVPAGFRLVVSSNASTFDLEETRIVATSSDDLAGARQARDLLGVGRVQVGNQTGGLADVTVVVGRDFGRP